MKQKIWIILSCVLAIALVTSMLFSSSHKRDVKDLKDEKTELKGEKEKAANKAQDYEKELKLEKSNEDKESENLDDPQENTFDEDTEWLVKNVYESLDRKKLHDEIADTLTSSLEKTLFGDEKLEESENKSDEDESDSAVEKSVHQYDFYGKYEDESTYEAVSTFNLELELPENTKHQDIVVKSTLKKDENGDWKFNEFEEIASHNVRDG